MFEEKQNQQVEKLDQFLSGFFKRKAWENNQFRRLETETKKHEDLPMYFKFEHASSGETLFLSVTSNDPLSELGVRISGDEADILDLEERLRFRLLLPDASDDSVSVLGSFSVRNLRELEETTGQKRYRKLEELFVEAGDILGEKGQP